ncbi:NAD(P)/FAD-dependent oxidoreductase [Halobacteriovorax sp. HLS]|uniref:NAD(P)/FAD-dependent oxidoreductase n=1 Tax=Halobacteriovorax sp. HLS TaxID=2234000 RepID=UPI0013E2D75B|nr:NAD(P)/FAD-dependent oxidoreductase [Halobacteriovorax sp. HLS]
MKIYDVAIIGAGPAGSILSWKLSKNRLSTIVFEGRSEVTRKVCGEYLCPLGVKLLKEIGLGEILKKFNPVLGMDIYTPKGIAVKSLFPETKNFNEKGVSLNRKVFDQALVDKSAASGTEFRFSSMITDIHFNGSFWTIVKSDGETFRSRLLVGADGRRSLVAKKMKLSSKEKSSRIAIHCWLKGENKLARKGQMHLFSDGSYIGIDPINSDEVNISLVCDSQKIKEFKNAKNVLMHFLNKSEQLKVSLGPYENISKVYTVFPVTHKVSDVISHQCALIGDAAGFLDPLTGEGIFNAIWSSVNLADSIVDSQYSLSNSTVALNLYRQKYRSFFRQKKVINNIFQWLIRREALVEVIGSLLKNSSKRSNAFIGIIGNVYKPLTGLLKIIF